MTIDSRNSFFTVAVLFRSLRDGRYLPENLWEESFLLLRATSDEQARTKAASIASAKRLTYRASTGETLTWEFFKISASYELSDDQLADGTEIFSRHLRDSEVQSLLTPFSDS